MPDTDLVVEFRGWFLCRLATDPDPTDEPRGVSGATFALAGEPDLDRVIVLRDPPPLVRRSHMPPVGVVVTRASTRGRELPAFAGARVNLLGRPVFENRNFVLTTAGREPIVPFDLSIDAPGLALRRAMVLAPEGDSAPPHRIPRAHLEKFGARVFRTDAEIVRDATGLTDPHANRVERHRNLCAELDRETDPVRRAGLAKRIRELDIAVRDPGDERVVNLEAIEEFRFPLTGQAVAEGRVPREVGVRCDEPWTVEFWMGGWDADVMCGYLSGTLSVPTVSRSSGGAR